MASGTIAFDRSNPTGSYLEGKIEWTSVANKDANTSDLIIQIYVRKRATNQQLTVPTTGAWRYAFTVNGQAIEGKSGGNTSVLQTFVLIATRTIKSIAHNADGTKNVSIVGFVQGPSISDGYKDKRSECNAVAKMDTIPRASQITSASNVTLGNTCNVKWTPASAAFRYRLSFKLGTVEEKTAIIHPNTTAAYSYTGYTIPLSFANQIPTSKTGTMTVTLTTYSDSAGTQTIGSYSKTFTVTVPDNESTRPSVEAALTPVSNLAGEYQNLYLQCYSKVKADVAAEGKYGATTNTPVLSINGVAQKSLTSGYLTSSGENTVSVSVTDSRGITRTISQTISVIPYVNPSLKGYGIGRSIGGQFNDSGTDLRIDATWDFAPVEQMNSCKLQYQLRAAGVAFDNNWTDIPSEEKAVSVVVENGLVAAENSYHVMIRVIDEIGNTAEATSDIPTDKVYWHRDGKRGSLTFGGYVEEDDTFAIAPGKTLKAQGSVELGEGEGGTKSFTIDEDGSAQFHVPVAFDKPSETMSNLIERTVATDANVCLESGNYYTTPDTTNTPVAGYGNLRVVKTTVNWIWQSWQSVYSSVVYTRNSRDNGVTFDNWDTGFVKKTGDTITGYLINTLDSKGRASMAGTEIGAFLEAYTDDYSYRRQLVLRNQEKMPNIAEAVYLAETTDGQNWKSYRLYGEHNPPPIFTEVWTNYDPTSTCPAQTVLSAEQLAGYEAVAVMSRLSTETENELPIVIARIGGAPVIQYGVASGQICRRIFTATSSGVTFGSGGKLASYNGSITKDDTKIIPTVIYGLKGIN